MGLAAFLPLFALAQSGEPVPPPPPDNWEEILNAPEVGVDEQSIEGRRRPGYEAPLPEAVTQDNKGALRALSISRRPKPFRSIRCRSPTAGG
jgi:hypothetical protein